MQNKKIVVYTSIFGGYDGLLPQPKLRGIDFVCFSDRPIKAAPWVVKLVAPTHTDPVRCAKEFKILPHRFFPDHEYSIWIDGNYLIVGDIVALIDDVLSKHDMAAFDHNKTCPDARDCAYKEHESLIQNGMDTGIFKDDPAIMAQQIDRYRAEHYPPNNGLIFASILLRRHNSTKVVETMEYWWKEIAQGSRRDQLSFNYAAWKTGLNFHLIARDVRDNPWFYQIGIHRSDYRAKMLRYRIKHFLGIIRHT